MDRVEKWVCPKCGAVSFTHVSQQALMIRCTSDEHARTELVMMARADAAEEDPERLGEIVVMLEEALVYERRRGGRELSYTRGYRCARCGCSLYDGYPFTVCDDCWPHRKEPDRSAWMYDTPPPPAGDTSG